MKFLSTIEIARRWNVSERYVRKLCSDGKIEGAFLSGKTWNIPEGAVKPKRVNAKQESAKEKILKIQELKSMFDSMRPLTEGELKRLNEEFMFDYTYNSNAIEGNTLTLQETTLVLQGVTINQKPLKDHLEAIGHKDAFYYIVEIVKEKVELNQSLIKQIHSLVLADSPMDRGVYRKVPVRIMGASHTPPEPFLIAKQMEEFILNYKKWKKSKNIVELASLVHLNFEFIHPFIDGNGRTGRLLINLLLMANGYPPINIKYTDRAKYYACFEDYYKTNKPNAMFNLLADLLIERLEEYIKILK